MKKEIIINASKDRSRIAIVEDGELVELYVENPDNVRTIGNIYLGDVQKVMPAIRAAFVNVGQKQDAFLHFSDLTDNAAQLIAMAGEDVPGLEAPVLSHAPKKRVADDESEPDVEDTLEIEASDEDTPSRTRSRSRRRSRGRGRGRGRRRSGGDSGAREEEEEQEEARKVLPNVIDLTSPPRRPKPEPPPEPDADTSAPEANEASEEAESSKTKGRSRRRTRSKTPAETSPDTPGETTEDADPAEEMGASSTPDTAAAEATPEPDDEPEAEASRRTRKPRRSNTIDLTSGSPAPAKPSEPQRSEEAGSGDAEAASSSSEPDASASDEASEQTRPRSRRRRGRRGRGRGRRAGDALGEEASSGDTDTTESSGKEADRSSAKSKANSDSRSTSGRSRGKATDTDDASSANDASETPHSGGRSRGTKDASGQKQDRAKRSENKETSEKGGSDRNTSRNRPSRRGGSGGKSASDASANVPSAESLLKRGTRVICKITKEPISTKGPRVSTDISLAGRFLVLVPAADYIAVSKKIESAKERRRLRTLAASLKPDGFGVIVRTVAKGRDAKSLDTDLRLLIDKWRKIERKLQQKPTPPVLLYEDVNMVSSIIRDLFSEDYDRIVVDDPKVHRNVQAYVKAVAPQMLDKVELHRKNQPVYRSYGIERQVEEAFSKRVNMKGGGYLYIETTEAMHVVDVNSGRAGRGKSQKENLIAVNVEAAKEIAKQLRLRDLGGIIVVDFIDLRYDRDRKKVTDALKEAFKKDRAVTKILPMSDFGLVQITRQRLRPSITTQTDEEATDGADAARAAGAAEIRQPDRSYTEPEPTPEPERSPVVDPAQATPDALAAAVRDWLDHYRRVVDAKYKPRPIIVRVHPLLGAYLRRGFPTPLTRWKLTLRGISFRVEDDASVDPLAFDVRDEKSGRSLLKKYST